MTGTGLGYGHGHHESIPIDWDSIKWNELTQEEKEKEEEKWNYEHMRMHQKHAGHAEAEMYTLAEIIQWVIVVIISQICLTLWKRWKPRSYHLCTLMGMWIYPLGLSIKNHKWRFLCIWLVFSFVTFLVIKRSLEKPIQGTTPRLVYKWFLLIHKISYFIGIFGFITVMATFLGLNMIFGVMGKTWMDLGLMCIYYALYYGVVSIDFAEICTDKMAANIGYYKSEGIPERHLEKDICAVCGLVSVGQEGVLEETFRLSCGHEFHKFCIRGWFTLGKKQTCPYCQEKLDLKKMFPKPWEKPLMMFGKLLSWVRWLVCQPVIHLLLQGFGLIVSFIMCLYLLDARSLCPLITFLKSAP